MATAWPVLAAMRADAGSSDCDIYKTELQSEPGQQAPPNNCSCSSNGSCKVAVNVARLLPAGSPLALASCIAGQPCRLIHRPSPVEQRRLDRTDHSGEASQR